MQRFSLNSSPHKKRLAVAAVIVLVTAVASVGVASAQGRFFVRHNVTVGVRGRPCAATTSTTVPGAPAATVPATDTATMRSLMLRTSIQEALADPATGTDPTATTVDPIDSTTTTIPESTTTIPGETSTSVPTKHGKCSPIVTDIMNIAKAYKAGDQTTMDAAVDQLKADLDASLTAGNASTTTTTTPESTTSSTEPTTTSTVPDTTTTTVPETTSTTLTEETTTTVAGA